MCIYLCVIAFYLMHYRNCITWDCFDSSHRALRVLFADCSLRDFMLHFYARINDDDNDIIIIIIIARSSPILAGYKFQSNEYYDFI